MENTKKWSNVFIGIGYIFLIVFLLIMFRIKFGFEYPAEQQYYLTLTSIKHMLLIMGSFSLLIGYAIKSIYREILMLLPNLDNKINRKNDKNYN